jgi:hypothetical protein
MKIKLTTIVLLCISTICYALNLDSIPQAERDSILIQLARTTVLLYGPRYYREGKTIIEQKNAESDIGTIGYSERDAMIKRNSSVFYSVTTFYDQTKELFDQEYVSKVNIWAVDPMPFEILFGNRYGYGLKETRGKEVQEVSTQFNASMDSAKIVKKGQSMGIKHMQYDPVPIQKIERYLKFRRETDSINNIARIRNKLELEYQIKSGSTFDDKVWKKLFKAERKKILVEFNKDLDRMEDILMRDIKDFKSVISTEYGQFNTVKQFKKLKKRIIFPSVIIDEKKLTNLKDKASVTSNMHYSPNEVSIYIGNRKNVFYRVTWKKTKEQWIYRNCERIPLSLSNKLIQSGLYKNRKKAETVVLQQDGKVKNLMFFKKRKKMTFLDSKNFLNDYQSTIPNFK